MRNILKKKRRNKSFFRCLSHHEITMQIKPKKKSHDAVRKEFCRLIEKTRIYEFDIVYLLTTTIDIRLYYIFYFIHNK
jgi:quinol monooxygenase YgiN